MCNHRPPPLLLLRPRPKGVGFFEQLPLLCVEKALFLCLVQRIHQLLRAHLFVVWVKYL